jgi:cystathionine beta-lyase
VVATATLESTALLVRPPDLDHDEPPRKPISPRYLGKRHDMSSPTWISDYERRSRSTKWRSYPSGTICAWVADMDFAIAPEITTALTEASNASDLGYPSPELFDTYRHEMASFSRARHGLTMDPDELIVLGDVVQGLAVALMAHRTTRTHLVYFLPAYPPFHHLRDSLHFDFTGIPLLPSEHGFEFDKNVLEHAFASSPGGVLLLCNPHNPTGKVFTKEELEAIGELALAYDYVIVSDEIHRDILAPNVVHHAIGSISPELASVTTTAYSASKTFNIAGLHAAALEVPTAQRDQIEALPFPLRAGASLPGLVGATAAFRHGAGWLDATLETINSNVKLVLDGLTDSSLVAHAPMGTYLLWIDASALHSRFGERSAQQYLLDEVGVALSPGEDFADDAADFVRLNVASSPDTLVEIVDRLLTVAHR